MTAPAVKTDLTLDQMGNRGRWIILLGSYWLEPFKGGEVEGIGGVLGGVGGCWGLSGRCWGASLAHHHATEHATPSKRLQRLCCSSLPAPVQVVLLVMTYPLMMCSLGHPGATHPATGKSITTSPLTAYCTSPYDTRPPRSLRDEYTTSSNPSAFSYRTPWPANSHLTPVPPPFAPTTNFSTAQKATYCIHEAFEILRLAI